MTLSENDPSAPWARPLLDAALAVGRGRPDVDSLLAALRGLGVPGCSNDVALTTGNTVARLSARYDPSRAGDIAATLLGMPRPGQRAQREALARAICDEGHCCEHPRLRNVMPLDCADVP